MAAPTRILSLSLGNQTVGLAEFKTGPNGGLILASYQTRDLLADPAADATRLAQTKLALAEMAQGAGLKNARVSYAISAQSLVGNLIDRLRFKYVIDFLDFHLGSSLKLPAFNIADFAILAGVALMFYNTLRQQRPEAA